MHTLLVARVSTYVYKSATFLYGYLLFSKALHMSLTVLSGTLKTLEIDAYLNLALGLPPAESGRNLAARILACLSFYSRFGIDNM